jgi:glutamine amidotransferase
VGLAGRRPFYFVHSYTPRPAEPADVLATAEHGERFACAIARPPLYGVQFHPEKSSLAGLRLLRNFASICVRSRPLGDRARLAA